MTIRLWLQKCKSLKLRLIYVLCFIVAGLLSTSTAVAADQIWIPVRWCGVEGATSMANPGAVNEASTDDVLWRRHERPTDAIYDDDADISFRAASTAAIKSGPQSFPIIRDIVGSGGDLINGTETTDAINMCRRAWLMGDPLYYDDNNNGTINSGTDTLLSTDTAITGSVDLGHNGGALQAVPSDVRYVDQNGNGSFDIGERIYRDENTNGSVDGGDTLLVNTSGTVVGDVNAADIGETLIAAPAEIKYLDLIRRPANTYNIGYPPVVGITAVSANDVEFTSIAFPVHGVAQPGISCMGAVMDDPAQYLPPGPDYILFETQLVAHEFGHSMGLFHGDGIDDDMDGMLDEPDDPTSPVPGAGPGTLCDSNNVMSYCWLDNGTSGNPAMEFIGVGTPTSGHFTTAQATVMRNHVSGALPDCAQNDNNSALVAARVDMLGDVEEGFEHLDIADFTVHTNTETANSMFTLTTRRPFPINFERTIDIYVLLDMDNNPESGGNAPVIEDNEAPTDFTGAEVVARVRLRGTEVESVNLLQYEARQEGFVDIQPDRVNVNHETLELIPDFPFDLRNTDPDSSGNELLEFPSQEQIRVILPYEILELSPDAYFRIEYILHDLDSGTLDRATSPGMNFARPVFPECELDPAIVRPGETTTVTSSGLLPDSSIHLLLGPDEVATGMADADGNSTLELMIPGDSPEGNRLVTVGSLAVTADCTIVVSTDDNGDDTPPDSGDDTPDDGDCDCDTVAVPTIIVIIVLVVILLIVILLLLLVILWRPRNRTR